MKTEMTWTMPNGAGVTARVGVWACVRERDLHLTLYSLFNCSYVFTSPFTIEIFYFIIKKKNNDSN